MLGILHGDDHVCWHHFRKVNLDTKPWMERYCVPAADQPFEIWRRWTTSGADNDGPPRWGWLIGTAELKSILKWVASRDNGNLASQKLRINLRKCFVFGRLGRLGHVGTREGGANRLIRRGISIPWVGKVVIFGDYVTLGVMLFLHNSSAQPKWPIVSFCPRTLPHTSPGDHHQHQGDGYQAYFLSCQKWFIPLVN